LTNGVRRPRRPPELAGLRVHRQVPLLLLTLMLGPTGLVGHLLARTRYDRVSDR